MTGYGDTMTEEVLLEEMLADVPDDVDKREGSVIYDALAPIASALATAYRTLDVVMDETFVDTASLQYLARRCEERGVQIKEASAAVIEGVFTPDTVELTNGDRFNCGDLNYVVTEKLSAGRYRLECETEGAVGNLHTGYLLPIQDIEGLETAEITGVLIPGEDADDTDQLRDRYYDSLIGTAFGGNVSDYKTKVSLMQGIGGVKVERTPNGGGTVGVTIINSEYGIPSQTLIDTVQTALDPVQNHGEGLGLAPIGHTVTVSGAASYPIRVTTSIEFRSGWDPESAQQVLEETIRDYFLDTAKEWEDKDNLVVRISLIESKILELDCVVDITDTRLNDAAANIILPAVALPALQSLEVVS